MLLIELYGIEMPVLPHPVGAGLLLIELYGIEISKQAEGQFEAVQLLIELYGIEISAFEFLNISMISFNRTIWN